MQSETLGNTSGTSSEDDPSQRSWASVQQPQQPQQQSEASTTDAPEDVSDENIYPGGVTPQQRATLAATQQKPKQQPQPSDEGDEGTQEPTTEQPSDQPTAQQPPSPIHQSLEQLRQSPTQTARASNLKQLLQTHAQNTPDDDRVKHDPVTGLFKGEYFKDDDPLHQAALSSVPLQQKSTLYNAQKSIAKKEPMHITYGAAPASGAIVPSRASRTAEYAEAPSPGRPEAKQQMSGHSFLPTAVGVTFGKKKGDPNKGFVQGISASALASNAQHLNDALGENSPYPELDGPKFGADLAGYIRNVNNGYHGDGSGPVTGTADVDIKPGKNYDPYPLTEHEANFLNATFHNVGATGKGETGRIARALKAAQGHEVTEEGETNPLRAKINQLEGAKRTFYPGQPEGEEPRKPWSSEMLEPTIRHFAGDLIHEVHHDPKEMAEELRPPPGTSRIEKVFAKEGIPRKEMVAAHVMPAKKEPPPTEEIGGPPGPGERPGQPREIVGGEEPLGPGEKKAPKRKAAQAEEPKGGISFASSSIREGMSYATAKRALKGDDHAKLRDYSDRLEKAVADAHGYEPGKTSDVIGDWVDSAENSQRTHWQTPSYLRRVMSALQGLHGAQKQVADFHYHPEGEHFLHNLTFNTDDPEKARQWMDEEGLKFRSITPKEKGQKVEAHLIDTDNSAIDGLENLKKKGYVTQINSHTGNAEFQGDEDGASREKAAGEYRRILEEIERDRSESDPQTRRGRELSKLASWLPQFRDEAERNFADLRKSREYEKQALEEDYRQAAKDREDIPEDQKQELGRISGIAKKWTEANPEVDPRTNHAYMLGKREFPRTDMRNKDVGEYFDEAHKKQQLDLEKPAHREKAANLFLQDIMHSLAGSATGGKPSEAYGWYDRAVRKTIDKVAEVAPEIKTDPAHKLAFTLALAITSQGQTVPTNAENAWHVYQYWKKHGELPTDARHFGGGTKKNAMTENFQKVNEMWKKYGAEKTAEILDTPMTVKELRDNYGLEVGGENMDHVIRGAMALGPKIGAFYSNLNGRFDPTTFDMWWSRDMNKLIGNMFNFSENSMKKGSTDTPAHLESLKELLANPEEMKALQPGQAEKMKAEIEKLEAVPEGKLTRQKALDLAPTIHSWAKEATKNYARSYGSEQRSYHPDFKTPENITAKHIHENAQGLSDAPRGAAERAQWRDIVKRVDAKLAEHGIKLTNSDKQALGWFNIKDVFRLAGANTKRNVDFLDAAYSLVRHVKNGQMPDLTEA